MFRSGEGDGCAGPRAFPSATGPPDVPLAVWLSPGRPHASAAQPVLGPPLKRRYVWVVPKANTAIVKIETLNTNVGVTINWRSEPPLGAR